jgi:hypothetical protein
MVAGASRLAFYGVVPEGVQVEETKPFSVMTADF